MLTPAGISSLDRASTVFCVGEGAFKELSTRYGSQVGSGTGPLTIAPFFLTVSMIFAADASTN